MSLIATPSRVEPSTPISLFAAVALTVWRRAMAHMSPVISDRLFLIVTFVPYTSIEPETIKFSTTAPSEVTASHPRLSHCQPGPDVTSCGTRRIVVPAGTPVLVASG